MSRFPVQATLPSPLPETVHDVAIVGAGVLGLAHAYHCARRGMRVAVFERDDRAAGASVRNFGMLWPIGQPAGPLREMARRSLEHWRAVLEAAGIWSDPVGSLHVAQHDDEAAVLEEFANDPRQADAGLELLDAEDVPRRSRAVRRDRLKRALFSPTETCVDPRQVIAGLPAWLAREFGVAFAFGAPVRGYAHPELTTSEGSFRANRLIVCTGHDTRTLYPDALAGSDLVPCKLQMLRSQAYGTEWRLGPMLAGGLTLRHYAAFADCPSLVAVKDRVARESPEFDRFGIHVMASQNGRGELVLGDSHEYGEAIEPFDKEEIDRLILDYLAGMLDAPGMRVESRWHGIYLKNLDGTHVIARPEPGVAVVTGLGGAGMTLSFGLAERVVAELG